MASRNARCRPASRAGFGTRLSRQTRSITPSVLRSRFALMNSGSQSRSAAGVIAAANSSLSPPR